MFKFVFLIVVFGEYKATSPLNNNAKRSKCLLIDDKIVEEDEETTKNKLSTSRFSNNCKSRISGLSEIFGTSVRSSSRDSSKHKKTPKCNNHSMLTNDDKFAIGIKTPNEEVKFEDRPDEAVLFKMPLLPIQRHHPSKLNTSVEILFVYKIFVNMLPFWY